MRRSFVAPLLLIAIGTLFLIYNLNPDLPLISLIARYWPYLLIGWGAVRMIEILYWWMRGYPLPAAGISGGEWVLAVFICLAGSGVWAAEKYTGWPRGRIALHGVELFGEKFTYDLNANARAERNARIFIDNPRGNTRIIGADVNEVRVTGNKTIRALDRKAADEAHSQSPLQVQSEGGRITIRLVQDTPMGDRQVSADLDITVPKTAALEMRGVYGDFDVSDIDGSVRVESDNAGVRLQNVNSPARIELNKSDMIRAVNMKSDVEIKAARGQDLELENVQGQVTIGGSYSGELQFRNVIKPVSFEGRTTDFRVESIPGELRVMLGRLVAHNVQGPLRLTSKTRDVELTDFRGSVEIQIERGDVELRPAAVGMARIDVQTRSGDVALMVPPGTGMNLIGTAERGEVENNYGEPLTVESTGEGKNRHGVIRGSMGRGPEVRLTTMRGDIRVHRVDRVLDPTPPSNPPPPPKPPRTSDLQKSDQ